MATIRSTAKREESLSSSNGVHECEQKSGDATKYEKKKRKTKKQRRRTVHQPQRESQWKCAAISCFFIIMLIKWSQRHFEWKKRHATLQRLKRAYSLRNVQKDAGLLEEESSAKEPQHQKREAHHNNEQQQNSTPRSQHKTSHRSRQEKLTLDDESEMLNQDMLNNRHGGTRWIDPVILPSIPGQPMNKLVDKVPKKQGGNIRTEDKIKFKVKRNNDVFAWEKEEYQERPPKVDYTSHEYSYPTMLQEPPKEGGYPRLSSLGDLMKRWPQDAVDEPPTPFQEVLLHFDFTNKTEMEAAKKFRDAELPFKLYNVPELHDATLKWTDEYLSEQFDQTHMPNPLNFLRGGESPPPRAKGNCQESPHSFFAFFIPQNWQLDTMGLPPTRNNDFTFERWAKHARYADSVGLDSDQPHFYFQAGVPPQERHQPRSSWTFVSRDLPSWSSTTANFIQFKPDAQKGIQCRLGERGVTAATHYDAGRNMVAMITGAKRYVLSPPKECSKLGIINTRGQSAFRHSLLNFAHINSLDNKDSGMSLDERQWLERASTSMALDTVLKAGEVLYIPSHWFHYITSLQKSAQCNARSGRHKKGSVEFGGFDDVIQCNAK